MSAVVGQPRTPYRPQMTESLSWTTGCRIPSLRVAADTLSVDRSRKNSGVWTPTIVSPAASYLSRQSRTCGTAFWQFIQPYVQNSTRTTQPRKPLNVSGSLLTQGPPDTSCAGCASRY